MRKKLLITGGAGFIGINASDYFLKRGWHVTIFDNFSRKGTKENIQWLKRNHLSDLTVVRGDIRYDAALLKKILVPQHAVVHLAAQVAVTKSIENPREDFETNALGTFNVLEAIRASRRRPVLIYASTNKVYGSLENAPLRERKHRYWFKEKKRLGIPETEPLDFHSPYGCSKGSADQYVHDYSRIFDLPTVVFRQSCIYGYRQFGIEDQGWVAWFVIAASLNKKLTIYGNGKQLRDVLFIDDLSRAFDLAIKHSRVTRGEIYNIGGGKNNTLSLLELLSYLENRLNRKIHYAFAAPRAGDQKLFVADIRKAKRDFSWQPRISVKEGVERLLQWVTQNKHLFA